MTTTISAFFKNKGPALTKLFVRYRNIRVKALDQKGVKSKKAQVTSAVPFFYIRRYRSSSFPPSDRDKAPS